MPHLIDGQYVLSEQAVYAIIWTFTAVATVSTALRIFSRTCLVKALGLDDYLIIFGQIAAIIISAFHHWQLHLIWKAYNSTFDVGIAFFFNDEDTFHLINKMYRSAIISEYSYLLILPVIKCSILAFYRRITPRKSHHYSFYAIAFIMLAQGIVNVLVSVFAIDPPSARWTYIDESKTREVYEDDYLQPINSGFQVLFDLIILAIPAPIIWRTKFSKRDKVGLIVIYLLSFLSLGSTIARLVKVSVYSDKGSSLETMKGRIDTIYWTTIEMMTVIICANLPAMPALIRYVSGNSTEASPSPTYYSHDDTENVHPSQSSKSKMQSWYNSLTESVHRRSLRITSRKSRSSESSMLQTSTADEKNANVHISDCAKSIRVDNGPQVAATVSTNEYSVTDSSTSSSGGKMLSRSLSSSSTKSFLQADRKNNFKSTLDPHDGSIYRVDEVWVEQSQRNPGIGESTV